MATVEIGIRIGDVVAVVLGNVDGGVVVVAGATVVVVAATVDGLVGGAGVDGPDSVADAVALAVSADEAVSLESALSWVQPAAAIDTTAIAATAATVVALIVLSTRFVQVSRLSTGAI